MRTEEKKIAIGYGRVSSIEQKLSGISISLQQEKIRLQAQLTDFQLDEIILDEGMSAKNLNRFGIQKIISLVKAKKIQAVIIYKLDRLTRRVKDLGFLIELFNKYNVTLISVRDSLDTQSAAGRLVINILGSIGEWERDTISERTSEALQHKRSLQEKTGGNIPFGFSPDGFIEKVSKEGKLYQVPKLVKNEVEQKVISLIHNLKETGYSLRAICSELEQRKYMTKTGLLKWNPKVIRDILQAA